MHTGICLFSKSGFWRIVITRNADHRLLKLKALLLNSNPVFPFSNADTAVYSPSAFLPAPPGECVGSETKCRRRNGWCIPKTVHLHE